MTSLIIPNRFRKRLEVDTDLDNIVKSIIRKFSPIVKENKLEFFPEYTDHGFAHINKTLEIADKIIDDETFGKLNTLDVGVIILSIFLHDLGMHLTYEAFVNMISTKSNDSIDKSIDKKTWAILWKEYLAEAKLWSEKKIKNMFNDDFKIKEPPVKREKATEEDKKFIGEFIRRNHPRIAYEICVFGFPTINGDKMEFSDDSDIDIKLKKIIGYIARSHGLNIWDNVKYIEEEFGRDQIKTTKNVHAIYVMVALRMADYLDMDKARANTPILKFRKINSTISELEWIKHNVVDHVAMDYQDDPESIFVYINDIKESKVYLAIDSLIKDMQKELDTCWAVLGKVYGAYENLKLTFRRIHSNMDNKDIFLKNVNFIPKRIKFDSNPDILKLLVQPLYGKNPAYGIREILQNAIDACIEKEKIINDKEEMKVIITISEDEKYLSVEDNGIGMNENILINYFLVAGASFRDSDMWKKVYYKNNKSIVPRSGKFGIGVFASFILGDEIEVETIRYKEDIGYKFKANIETDQIQLIKFENNDKKSGTKIKLKLYDGISDILKEQFEERQDNKVRWNKWYYASNPKLIINVPTSWNKLSEHDQIKINLYDEELDEDWSSIKPEGFYRVDWTYRLYENNIFYNGITIQDKYYPFRFETYRFPEEFNLPSVSVVDNDANLPLNLDRNGISDDKLPFENDLVTDIYKDIISKLLVSKSISELHKGYLIIKDTKLIHPSIGRAYVMSGVLKSHELLLSKRGFNILHSHNIKKLNLKSINKIWIDNKVERLTDSKLISNLESIVVTDESLTSIQKFKEAIESSDINLGKKYDITNKRIFIKKKDFDYIFEDGKKRMTASFRKDIKIENKSENWYCITYGNIPKTNLDINDFEKNTKTINLFVEYYYKENTDDDMYNGYSRYYYKCTILEDIMDKYISEEEYIPYDIKKRRNTYKEAFKELSKYMNKYKE
ncbi:HD domain-containing protein [Clostridium sp. CTA-1]